jgi:CBS domain-containing protein
MIAQDVMTTRFHCLNQSDTVASAVKAFKEAGAAEGRRVFGMMVTDAADHLVGMLSMYDILVFIQPKHVHIWGEMDDMDPGPLFDALLDRVKHVRVADIMTTEVTTVKPDTHLLVIVDMMINRHIRRIPVVADGEIVGMVYRSEVFFSLLDRFVA